MKNTPLLALSAVLAIFPCAGGAQTALVTERTLSVNAALEAARAALEYCRNDGSQVTVTVLDHAGRTKVMLRDDGSRPHSVQHSLNKAHTALTYREPSGEWGKRAVKSVGGAGALHLEKIATAADGLPIRAGDTVVGAIGVSGSSGAQGAPGGQRDEACAQAGIDRISKGLGG